MGSEDGSRQVHAGAEMEGLPRRFGKYTLIRKLAVGGMAELFLAIFRSVAGFEKLVVITRILPEMNDDKAFISMFLHEARVAATLSHPNIVQIFDVGQVEGKYFIAMEHVHGEDLRSIVRQMRKKGVHEFPLEHAISIILGMCAGLANAHEKRDIGGSALNIVHRDISPQNTVITYGGDVKIVDFGIAKSDVRHHADTRSGRLKGKVPYMSPEQARGEVVDWRSDIFAVGVMFFELTTGKRLFKGASEYETLKLICDREYPLPSEIREGYPRELEEIVMRALAKDREHRYQSARELQQALEEFVRRERIPVSTIALNHFMQSLFEDTLASQEEALLQGKNAADDIELRERQLQQKLDGVDEGARLSQSILSTPAASRTLTEIKAMRRRRGVALGVAGALALTGFVALGMVRSKEAGSGRREDPEGVDRRDERAPGRRDLDQRRPTTRGDARDGVRAADGAPPQREADEGRLRAVERGRRAHRRGSKGGGGRHAEARGGLRGGGAASRGAASARA